MPTEPLAPVDTTVVLPPSIQRIGANADALHAQVYGTPTPPEPPAPPEPPQPPEPPAPPEPPQPPEPPAPPEPPQAPARRAAVPESGEPGSWEHRYLAMKGRFDQSQTTIGSMQEQMSELGDELIRAQNQLLRVQSGLPQPQAPQPPRPARALRDEDVNTYGSELVDFVQRAARDAVAPDLARVASEVQHTNQKVTQTVHQTMHGILDSELPDWRNINVDPRFKAWCRLQDVYSGQVRGKLLNAAFQAADAPRVIAFFQGFLNEEQATGQIVAPQPEPPPEPAAPRAAAVPLATLAAPGRAKPATGGSASGSAEKPVFTRAQIAEFYSAVRKGLYAGREADKDRDEAAIYAAQREGRVR